MTTTCHLLICGDTQSDVDMGRHYGPGWLCAERQRRQFNGNIENTTDLSFTLVNATVTKLGTFDVALKLFVALYLTFFLTTSAFLAHHLTALSSNSRWYNYFYCRYYQLVQRNSKTTMSCYVRLNVETSQSVDSSWCNACSQAFLFGLLILRTYHWEIRLPMALARPEASLTVGHYGLLTQPHDPVTQLCILYSGYVNIASWKISGYNWIAVSGNRCTSFKCVQIYNS